MHNTPLPRKSLLLMEVGDCSSGACHHFRRGAPSRPSACDLPPALRSSTASPRRSATFGWNSTGPIPPTPPARAGWPRGSDAFPCGTVPIRLPTKATLGNVGFVASADFAAFLTPSDSVFYFSIFYFFVVFFLATALPVGPFSSTAKAKFGFWPDQWFRGRPQPCPRPHLPVHLPVVPLHRNPPQRQVLLNAAAHTICSPYRAGRR